MNFTMTNESISFYLNGEAHTILANTPQYIQIAAAILAKDYNAVADLVRPGGALAQWLGSAFTVEGENIKHHGTALPNDINRRIWEMAAAGESPMPLLNFFERLAKNPSYRSVQSLFGFMKHGNIPLNEDGTFLTYKKVRADFLDCHSGTIDNTPGRVIKMARNQISDDPQHPCHEGLHVGALGYVSTFTGEEIVICKVDPENVVSVPYDCNAQKMRVCEYEVIGLYSGTPMPSTTVDPEFIGFSFSADDAEELDWQNDNEEPEDEPSEPKPVWPPSEQEYWTAPHNITPEPAPAPKRKSLSRFGKYDAHKLMEQSVEDLRRYAAGTLKLVGASKLAGGKSALVSKIVKLRKKAK